MPDSKDNSNTSRPTDEEIKERQKWGYDLYPERKGEFKPSITQYLFGDGRQDEYKFKCERNIYNCFMRSKCAPNTKLAFTFSLISFIFLLSH